MAEPATITIQHVLVSFQDTEVKAPRSREDAEKLAEDVLRRAREGEDFADLVRECSDDPHDPKDADPGVYRLANTGESTMDFGQAVSELNERAAKKQEELQAEVNSGRTPIEKAEEQMGAFVDELRAEADELQRTMPHPRASMVKAFGDVGFGLEPGEVGMAEYDDEASPFGWHVIKRIA